MPTQASKGVAALALTELKAFGGAEGYLVALESGRQVPFVVRRIFYVWGVPKGCVRGRHAHRDGHQFFVSLNGACRFVCDDGRNRREFLLDKPDVGLYLPPMIWGEQTYLNEGAVAVVFADRPYDRSDYIEDYDVFVQLMTARGGVRGV